MDSGASVHIMNNTANLDHATRSYGKENIIVGNGEHLEVKHTGSTTLPNQFQTLNLRNVLHAPKVTKNLISVSKLNNDNDVLIQFDSCGYVVKDKRSGRTLLKGKQKDELYEFIDTKPRQNLSHNSEFIFSTSRSNKKLWHLRLGHPSERVLNQVLQTCNIKISDNGNLFCEPCQYGKNKALPFKLSDSKATSPLQLIHTDLRGPSPVQSNSRYQYYIQFLDDFSRYSWIYPLKNKSEAFPIFLQFKKLVEKQLEKSIKVVQSDWGGEYRSFANFLQTKGIIFRQSCPHTSVQNGRVERRHRQIVEVGLTLLAQASMPLQYWWDSFQNVVFLINRLPSIAINNFSPFYTLFQKQPDYSSIRVFGSACYHNLRSYNPHKFAYHTTKCVYLGVSDHQKGFRCLSSTGCVYISRHVVFNEEDFPFQNNFFNKKREEQSISNSSPLLSTMDLLTWQSYEAPTTHGPQSTPDSPESEDSSTPHPSCDDSSPNLQRISAHHK